MASDFRGLAGFVGAQGGPNVLDTSAPHILSRIWLQFGMNGVHDPSTQRTKDGNTQKGTHLPPSHLQLLWHPCVMMYMLVPLVLISRNFNSGEGFNKLKRLDRLGIHLQRTRRHLLLWVSRRTHKMQPSRHQDYNQHARNEENGSSKTYRTGACNLFACTLTLFLLQKTPKQVEDGMAKNSKAQDLLLSVFSLFAEAISKSDVS